MGTCLSEQVLKNTLKDQAVMVKALELFHYQILTVQTVAAAAAAMESKQAPVCPKGYG